MGYAVQYLLESGAAASRFVFESIRHRISHSTFSLDPALREQLSAQFANARTHAASAGVPGFLGLFAVGAVLFWLIQKKDPFDKLVQFKQKGGDLQDVDVFGMPSIENMAMEVGGAAKIKELLDGKANEGGGGYNTFWNTKRTTPSYQKLLLSMLKKPNGLDRVCDFLFLNSSDVAVRNTAIVDQFDCVVPVLKEMAKIDGGKEKIKAFLNQDVKNFHCKFLQ
jgi:hypothetical protein